jgi:alkanesulfonate monooxygenase SsuD/methylene tetrahydromethanopterin reductase-like flavin-dependent oxidoreductase (luciferase family)
MKLDTGLATEPLARAGVAARAAEDAGFDALWTSETNHDPFLPLVLAAKDTSRIQLGTSIAVAFPRSPMVLAQLAWDLQALSNGRFVLGLGTQVKAHNERRFGVKWEAPGPRLREMLEMIRAIWMR